MCFAFVFMILFFTGNPFIFAFVFVILLIWTLLQWLADFIIEFNEHALIDE